MIKATVTITLTLTGPILTQSTSPDAWGIDSVAARNHAGQFYLSGTLLVGKLRQAWQELQNASQDFKPDITKWLGKASDDGHRPETKQLYFSDLICHNADKGMANKRITIDAERGAVQENQLLVIENPFLTGKDYDFIGELHFFALNQDEVTNIVHHVNVGLHWTEQLGALRSVGFGRLKKIECATETDTLQHPQASDNVGIAIQPLYPFCINDRRINDNLFESVAIISGAVILGSIVTTWLHLCGKSAGRATDVNDPQRQMLKKHFSLLRMTHAVPSEKLGVRPLTLPLSLVKVPEDDTLYDVILLDKPCLINNKPPAFAIDWKEPARTELSLPDVTKELRTRTQINPDTLRAEDEKLFAYEQIVPNALTWNAQLDLSRIPEPDRTAVLSELQSLLSQGLGSLGKTKTPATVAWLSSFKNHSNSQALTGKQWIITLQTDTLLGSPEGLNESTGQAELEAMYKQAWSESSDKTLQLIRYFARQRLSGGQHRHKLFQQTTYKPWLLTEAGSVFLLQADDETAGEAVIKDWLARGLPLKGEVLKYYEITENEQEQWQQCPFIPQNGYGEVAVNLAIGNRLTATDKKLVTPISVL